MVQRCCLPDLDVLLLMSLGYLTVPIQISEDAPGAWTFRGHVRDIINGAEESRRQEYENDGRVKVYLRAIFYKTSASLCNS